MPEKVDIRKEFEEYCLSFLSFKSIPITLISIISKIEIIAEVTNLLKFSG